MVQEHADSSTAPTDQPVSLGDLVPEAGGPRNLTEDQIYDRFFSWVASQGITPWPHQEEAVLSLASGDHVILSTPTGSGKSMVALAMHFIALCT